MKRILLEIQFDGTNYHGYQLQDNVISVQQELEEKLSILFQEKVVITGASRTDTGVHIKQTYAHFDTEKEIPKDALRRLNFMLPGDIALNKLVEVGPKFHSRFDAIQRQYIYHIHYKKDPFLINKSLHFPYQPLNLEKMNEAADFIKTQTDFKTFCKRNSHNKTTLCRIDKAEWRSTGPDAICFEVYANRFLRGMVRGLVGTMMKVGKGKLTLDAFKAIVTNGDNRVAYFAVPGCGLYLTAVVYPEGLIPQD